MMAKVMAARALAGLASPGQLWAAKIGKPVARGLFHNSAVIVTCDIYENTPTHNDCGNVHGTLQLAKQLAVGWFPGR